MSNSTKFFYSYTDFVNERNNFKIVDRTGLNRYDSPAALYYKLVFYFTEDSGLLGLNGVFSDTDHYISLRSDLIKKGSVTGSIDISEFNRVQNLIDTSGKTGDYTTSTIKNIKGAFYNTETQADCDQQALDATNIRHKDITNTLKNTAYNYLLLNAEYERAHLLDSFITLLSEINSSSPWYFQEITGLDTALERKMFSDGEFKLEDKPRQITIKCLHDAYDNRIGTLLDLYRAACFSYTEKKEIVPANLRKFNMGVLVFNAPIRGKGGKSGEKENMIIIPDKNTDQKYYIPSAKLIELRNCEIDYNSSKSAWSTLNTSTDPFSPEYTITINFDDCYESRYNEIMGSVVTDFINADTNLSPNVKTINDNSALGNNKTNDITGKQDVEKEYWTNSDYETAEENLYTKKLDYNSNTSNINIDLNVGTSMAANVLTSQWSNLKDKAKDFIQIPSINKDDNIHDYGHVNMYGEFEYLNRLDGMNDILGNVAQQVVGSATNFARKEAAKLYLGNIRSWSVSNAIEMGKRFLSGDVAGGIQDIERLSGKEGELVRPIGGKRNIGEGLPDGGFVTTNIQDNTSKTPAPKKMPKRVNDPEGNPIDDRFITSEIHNGGEIGRTLNKGEVLDVDIINHTRGSEHELAETHFTTENIHGNTSKIPVPRKMPKRHHDPEGNLIDDKFITSEIWPDPISRNLNKGTILDEDVINDTLGKGNKLDSNSWEGEITERQFTTKEIWPDPIQRNLYKGELIDEDVVNSTLGSGTKIDGKMAWTGETTEAYLRNMELYADTRQRNIEGTPTQTEISKDPSQRNIEGVPSQIEIWKDPFQRNIDSNMTTELPGYIKGRTKFLNEMNTKQSIRNNI